MNDIETITLYNEKGKSIEFDVLGTITVDEKDYAILHPITSKQQVEDVAYIFKIESNEKGDEIFKEVEDDEEFEKIKNAWESVIDSNIEVFDEEN